jgi:phage virion morphogenesis protein
MLNLRLDAQGAIQGLQGIGGRYGGRMKDLSPAIKDMGERMRFSIEENFRRGGRPAPWKPLAPATVEARARMGKGPTPILILNSFLKNTIAYAAYPLMLIIGAGGPSTPYARIHQLGGMAGRGKKVRIPARPFLVVQESDLDYFRKRIIEHCTQ